MIERGNLWKPKPTEFQKPKKKETTITRGNPLCSDDSEIPGMAARIQGEFGG